MGRHSRRLGIGVAAIATTALALAGCGGSSTPAASPSPSKTDNGVAALSAQEILNKSDAAVKNQSSVHMKAEGTQNGEPLAFDFSVTKTSGGSGSLTMGKAGQAEFVVNETSIWLKASKEFWTSNFNAATAELIGNRWLKVPASNESYAYLKTFGSYDSTMSDFMKPKGEISKGAPVDLNGQPAVILKSSEGEMWIATTGEPLPLQQKGTSASPGADSHVITASEWGTATVATPPPENDTIDVSKLPASTG